MKKQVLRIALLLCATAVAALPLAAESVSVKTSGVKGLASAKDKNILSNSMSNRGMNQMAAPESKGGAKSRGAFGTCNIHVDNHTGYYVTFYFNGSAAGSMGPWGDLYPNVTEGMGQLYARAVFDNGTVLTFGPRDYQCNGQDFIWTLTP
jgi:hypothetical protein